MENTCCLQKTHAERNKQQVPDTRLQYVIFAIPQPAWFGLTNHWVVN